MRISDWSSDVCSSDLDALAVAAVEYLDAGAPGRQGACVEGLLRAGGDRRRPHPSHSAASSGPLPSPSGRGREARSAGRVRAVVTDYRSAASVAARDMRPIRRPSASAASGLFQVPLSAYQPPLLAWSSGVISSTPGSAPPL